uniref:DUF4801 domain-containing protein n=1 Tax=Elaeophora elaphi TaxID=1147741 RepID=A0A0R3RXS0_9BILA
MFAQTEEEWKERDDLSGSECRRRITHEDICSSYDLRQFRSHSLSEDWRKSTDHCSGFSDYVTLFPSHLWFRNDLGERSRQQCCNSLNGCCNCCSRSSLKQQHCHDCRNEAIRKRRKHWNAWNSTNHADAENLRAIRVIPMTFISKSAAKYSSSFQKSTVADSKNAAFTGTGDLSTATDVPYYGPFLARKILITPALMAVTPRKYRSVHECYLAERKYRRKIQNAKPKLAKRLALVNEAMMHDKSNDSTFVSDAYYDINPKHLCSEFDEIPLFVPTIYDQFNSSSRPSINIIDKFEERLEKNSMSKENYHETGRDTLLEGLALLKHRKKEQDEKSVVHENDQIETFPIHAHKNPIKKIATYWHKRTLKKYNRIKRYSQKSDQSSFDRDRHMQQNDLMKSETMPIIPDGADKSAELKFITELRQVQESLRKISSDLGLIIGNRNVSKSKISLTDTELEIGPKLSSPYCHEILTTCSTEPFADSRDRMDAEFEAFPAPRTFHITGKTESKPHNTMLSTAETATIITPALEEPPSQESALYKGRKHETITAEVFIRNPRILKPTIINVSVSDKKSKKPCWVILKAYESPPSVVGKKILRKKFNKTIMRIESDASIYLKKSNKSEKLKATNFYETASTKVISKLKQETSERGQTKISFSSDSELRTKTNLTIETQLDTSIKSRIITESNWVADWNFEKLITIVKNYEKIPQVSLNPFLNFP